MNSDKETKSMTLDDLTSKTNNFHLSDKHYLELKHGQEVIVKWISILAEKNQVPIDLTELEYK